MKPFIKPRLPVTPGAQPARSTVSPSELTILAVACAIADPAERAAYLERVCGEDADLRERVERKLAEREEALRPVTIPRAERAEVMAAPAPTHPAGQGAVAIVPMPNMQLTPAGSSHGRHSPFPWALAVLLAAAVGALAVFFLGEKSARETAEHRAKAAAGARDLAESERATAIANANDAKAAASRAEEKRAELEKLRAAADSHSTIAEAETKAAKEEALVMKSTAETAKLELEKTRQQLTAAVFTARAEWAATLTRLATTLVDSGRHGEAEAPARQAFELQNSISPRGWATQEARYVLGSALMGKGNMPAAEQELGAAIMGMEPFLPQAPEASRARYVTAVKKLAQLYRSTGRKAEATTVLKRLEMQPPPVPPAAAPTPAVAPTAPQ